MLLSLSREIGETIQLVGPSILNRERGVFIFNISRRRGNVVEIKRDGSYFSIIIPKQKCK